MPRNSYVITDMDYAVLDLATHGEYISGTSSTSQYNTVNGYSGPQPVEQLTIRQVLSRYSTAVGRYQFTDGTLPDLITGLGDEDYWYGLRFTRTVQDYMALVLIRQRAKYAEWKNGGCSDNIYGTYQVYNPNTNKFDSDRFTSDIWEQYADPNLYNDAAFLFNISKIWAAKPIPVRLSTRNGYPRPVDSTFYAGPNNGSKGTSATNIQMLKFIRENGEGESYTVTLGGSRAYPPEARLRALEEAGGGEVYSRTARVHESLLGEAGAPLATQEAARAAGIDYIIDPNDPAFTGSGSAGGLNSQDRVPTVSRTNLDRRLVRGSESPMAGILPRVSTPYAFKRIDPLDNRYDFRTGQKVIDFSVNGVNPASMSPRNLGYFLPGDERDSTSPSTTTGSVARRDSREPPAIINEGEVSIGSVARRASRAALDNLSPLFNTPLSQTASSISELGSSLDGNQSESENVTAEPWFGFSFADVISLGRITSQDQDGHDQPAVANGDDGAFDGSPFEGDDTPESVEPILSDTFNPASLIVQSIIPSRNGSATAMISSPTTGRRAMEVRIGNEIGYDFNPDVENPLSTWTVTAIDSDTKEVTISDGESEVILQSSGLSGPAIAAADDQITAALGEVPGFEDIPEGEHSPSFSEVRDDLQRLTAHMRQFSSYDTITVFQFNGLLHYISRDYHKRNTDGGFYPPGVGWSPPTSGATVMYMTEFVRQSGSGIPPSQLLNALETSTGPSIAKFTNFDPLEVNGTSEMDDSTVMIETNKQLEEVQDLTGARRQGKIITGIKKSFCWSGVNDQGDPQSGGTPAFIGLENGGVTSITGELGYSDYSHGIRVWFGGIDPNTRQRFGPCTRLL